MATRRHSRDSLLAGLLVMFAIAASVVIVIAISGGVEQLNARTYTVAFPLETGVPNLQRGSDVQLGGLRVGSVGRIGFETDSNGDPTRIMVSLNVDRRYRLHEDAVGVLKEPLLGGASVINFPTPGTSQSPVAASDFPLRGRLSGGLLAAAGLDSDAMSGIGAFLSGLDGDAGKKVTGIINNVHATTERVDRVAQTLESTWSPDVTSALAGARDLVASLRADYPAYRDQTMAFLEAATEASQGTSEQIAQLRARGESFLALLEEVVQENREPVRATISSIESAAANADAITGRVRDETIDLAHQTMRDAQAALAKAHDAVARVDSLVVEQTPTIRRTAANLRLSADQLRDTMIEIRRSPWRLLYRPDQRETAYELLYDTARSYAGAVSDLRAASEALDAIAGAAERNGRPIEPALLEQLTAHLERAFAEYEAAERRFLELISSAAGR
jgi:ABC-type transporter Mla subunit MlaD